MRNFIFLILLSAFILSAHARSHAQGTGRTQTSQPQECKRLCAQDDQYPNAIMDPGETLRQNTCVCTADGVIFYPSNRGILFGEPIGISWDGWMSQDRIVGNTNDLAVPPFEGPGFSDIFMGDDEDAPSYATSPPLPPAKHYYLPTNLHFRILHMLKSIGLALYVRPNSGYIWDVRGHIRGAHLLTPGVTPLFTQKKTYWRK